MLQRRPIDFAPYLARWALVPEGNPIATLAANLLPVLYDGAPAMLKVAHEPDEIFGASVMAWWDGDGAARILAHDGEALLMERATGSRSLVTMVRDGRDDDASRTICAAANRRAAQTNVARLETTRPLVRSARAGSFQARRRARSCC